MKTKSVLLGVEWSQVLLPVFTLVIFVVQFQTGFFIPAEFQIGALYLINMISRMAVGRDIFGTVKPIVENRYNFTTKKLTETKTFWALVIGTLAIGVQIAGKAFGFELDIMKYSVPILSGIGFIVGLITHQPVTFKSDSLK